MTNPLVSVIIPAYNCEAFIAETLQSVLAQTFADFEVIVVDDASNDATPQILQQFARLDERIRVLTQESNAGQGACRNRGTREARGRYIAFNDADDLWLPQKLERQLEFMQERRLPFCFCGYGTIDESGATIIADLKIPQQTDYHSLLKSNTICTPSVVYDRERLGDIVMLERPHRREDLISWLGVSRQLSGRLQGLPDPLCMIRRLPGSSSSNKLKTLRWQWGVYRDTAHFGVPRSILYLAIFILTSLAKRSATSVALKRHRR